MKVFFVTLALLMAGLVFVAPPLIAVAPMLFIGLLLLTSPLLSNKDDGVGVRANQGLRGGQRPTPGTTTR